MMTRQFYQNFGKRGTDILLSFLGIVFLWPLLLITALIIKLDSPGPAFFKQKRVGKNGKIFYFYKFRNMVKNAERIKKKYLHLNEANGPVFKIRDDPRYTRVGKFLSHTGLDELPQLVNILKGEMSLVGPRPLPINEEKQIPKKWQNKRRQAKPGLACSWLLKGAHELSFKKWMELDLEGIEKSSFNYDLSVFLETVFLGINLAVQKALNAYSFPLPKNNRVFNLIKKLSITIQESFSFILLSLAYFFGIGVTAIIAKTTGKHFLEMKAKKTSWQKHIESKDLKKMY